MSEIQAPQHSNYAFRRAVLFGLGGAILGFILCSATGIMTGLDVGYVSLAVGFIVGRTMMMGSLGVGGRRYQLVAVMLTYAAVSLSVAPLGISRLLSPVLGLVDPLHGLPGLIFLFVGTRIAWRMMAAPIESES